MVAQSHLLLEVLALLILFASEVVTELLVLILHYANALSLLLILLLFSLDVVLHHLAFFVKLSLLIVVFVFQSEEMLVKRDSVTQQSLITRSFVFLVNFSFFE